MYLKQVFHITLALVTLITCSNAANPDAEAVKHPVKQETKPSKRALLIGINKYAYVNQLQGCINDVAAMKTVLIGKFGFPGNQVVTLTEQKAKRKNILDAIHELIRSTNKGDVVVIHYSGHGSQIKSCDRSENDKLDETIIPYDYRDTSTGALPITDKQLANALNDLCNKTNNVTVILDCCHSGGGTKDISFNERNIKADTRQAPLQDDFLPAAKELSQDNAHLKKDNSKYVLVTGCLSNEKSYEVKINGGTYHGILTYSLVNILKNSTEAYTWPEAIEQVRVEVGKSYGNQTPQLEGLNKASYIFGDPYVLKTSYVVVQPIGSTMVKIDGGSVYGQTKGSIFKIFPPGTIDFSVKEIADAMITKVDAFTSEARIVTGNVPAPACRAIEVKHVFEKGNLFVNFKGNWNGSLATVKQKLVTLNGISEEKSVPNLIFYKKSDSINIYASYDTVHLLQYININDQHYFKTMQKATNLWIKWFHLAQIQNPNPTLKFDVSFKKDGVRSIDYKKPDYVFKDGETVSLKIKNNSTVPIYVYIIDLEDNSNITPYPLSTFIDANKNSNEPIAAGDSVTTSFEVHLNGKEMTRDIIKIFAVDKSMDFDYFKQSGSATPEFEAAKIITPKVNNNLGAPDSWNSIERLILVTK